MWGSGFTWLTFGIKYWNKCSEQGRIWLTATPFKVTTLHVKQSREESESSVNSHIRRACYMSSVTSLQACVTLPSRAQTSLCSQFNCATNRKICCIIPSFYPNDVQIIFVQGSLTMAKRSHESALQRIWRKKREEEKTHRYRHREKLVKCH